jgi:hypothetical protein
VTIFKGSLISLENARDLRRTYLNGEIEDSRIPGQGDEVAIKAWV